MRITKTCVEAIPHILVATKGKYKETWQIYQHLSEKMIGEPGPETLARLLKHLADTGYLERKVEGRVPSYKAKTGVTADKIPSKIPTKKERQEALERHLPNAKNCLQSAIYQIEIGNWQKAAEFLDGASKSVDRARGNG